MMIFTKTVALGLKTVLSIKIKNGVNFM